MKYTRAKPSGAPCTKSWDGRVKKQLYCSRVALSLRSVLFAVSVSKFPVSFCLIRNLTMFSLVTKKKKPPQKNCRAKQQGSHLYSAVMFFSLIQFEAPPTGALYRFFFFFHVALAFKLQRKHSLKCVLQKKTKQKKKKLYPSPVTCDSRRTHRYVLNLCNLVINVDPVCPIRYLSPVLLNRGELQTLQKLRLRMPVVSECDAKRAPRLFPGRSLVPFSSLMIHLPIIKHTSLSCLVCSKKA